MKTSELAVRLEQEKATLRPGQSKLRQIDVDKDRLRLAYYRLKQYVRTHKNPNIPLAHVRYPAWRGEAIDGPEHAFTPGDIVEVREGNPPANSDRNKWERDVNLVIDIGFVHPKLAAALIKSESNHARNVISDEVSKDFVFVINELSSLLGIKGAKRSTPSQVELLEYFAKQQKRPEIPKAILNKRVSNLRPG